MRLTLVSLGLAGLLLVGCAQPAQKAVEQAAGTQSTASTAQATGSSAQPKGENVTVKGTQGEAITAGAQVPDELKSFPAPKGFTSQGGGTITKSGDKLSVASWKGGGTVAAAADFYKATLPGQGWKEDSTLAVEDSVLLNYTRDGQTGITVAITKDSGDVAVSVMLGKTSSTPTPGSVAGSGGEQANATSTPARAAAAGTAAKIEPTATTAAPQTTGAGSIPAELRDIPIPAGFAPVKDTATRVAQGGSFAAASMKWFGKASVKDAAASLQRSLSAGGWKEDLAEESEDSTVLTYTSQKDASLHLVITVEAADEGTEIGVMLAKQ